jgi:hypothetical protein
MGNTYLGEYMNSGNVILATSKTSLLSKLIRWFTSSQFSHSFVTMPDTLGFPMCIEAEEGGVDCARLDTNYLNNTDEAFQVWTLNVSQDVKDQALKQIVNDLEVPYGFLEYGWFIWRRLNKLFGRDIKNQDNWSPNSGIICSQLCVAYLKACGLQSCLNGYGNGSIAPQDLQDIFKAHPELFTLTLTSRM